MEEQSKIGAVVKLIVWSLVLILVIGLLAGFLVGGSFELLSIGGVPVFRGYSYDDGNTYTVGDCDYDERIECFDISWIAGKVNIVVWDGPGVSIKETGAGTEYDDQMRSKVENGKLIIHYVRGGFRLANSYPEKELTVYLPFVLAEEFVHLKVDSASANILLDGTRTDQNGNIQPNAVGFQWIELNTASGDVSITGVKVQDLEIDAVSGVVEIKDCTVEELDAETVSGGVTVWSGNLEQGSVDSVSGSIRVECKESLPSELQINTVSGGVELVIPRGESGFVATLDTVSGKLYWNGGSGERYSYGNGLADYDFESVSGSVIITFSEN